MPAGKTIIVIFFFTIGTSSVAWPKDTEFIYLKYALDGLPIAILASTREDDVWVVTDAASLIQVRWKEGIQKILPLRKGVKGASPRPAGGVLIWFDNGDVEFRTPTGDLVHQMHGGNGAILQARETIGGYTVLAKEENRIELYSLSGNKLLEWKREGIDLLPLQISEEDTILDARSGGICIIRRIDGAVLAKLQIPLILLEEGSTILHVSFPLDLKGARVTAFAPSPGGSSFWVGDSEWVLHWIRSISSRPITAERLSGISKPLPSLEILQLPDTSEGSFPTEQYFPAEQYFLDLARSSFMEKNLQLIEEAKESFLRGNLRWILSDLKKGLRVLASREEAGVFLRIEAMLLLGRVGDRFDGEWMGKRLIHEKDPAVQRSILEALHLLANAPAQTTREALLSYLKNRQKHLELRDLQLSLSLLKRWMIVSGIPLQPAEMEQLSSLAALSSPFQKAILEFIRN